MEQVEAIADAILGCAVGDTIGLAYEGLSSRRGLRLLGKPDRYRFLAGFGRHCSRIGVRLIGARFGNHSTIS